MEDRRVQSLAYREITISPRRLGLTLFVIVAALLGGHVALLLGIPTRLPRIDPEVLTRLFDMDKEHNVPTWYSSAALLLCAALALLVSRTCASGWRGHRWHWAGLGTMLAFLSLDELAQIHEHLALPIANQMRFASPEWHSWAWVLPYVTLAIVVAAGYLPFWRALPRRTRTLLTLATVLYVAGAGGLEVVSAFLYNPNVPAVPYLVVATMEEVIEMAAIVVLTYALVTHLRDHVGPVVLSFEDTTRPVSDEVSISGALEPSRVSE